MNKNAKLLPHLNQLFLQKQSYTSHKKKILQIRMKKPRITIRQQLSPTYSKKSSPVISLRDSKLTSYSKTPKGKLTQIPPTILQKCQSLGNSVDWMNPYRKRRYFDQLKQNQRMKSKIVSSKSNIQKVTLQKQYQKFARIKERLKKFQINPQSNKAMLKSQKALKITIMPKGTYSAINHFNQIAINRKSLKFQKSFLRKQSNLSVFLRKTQQIKQSRVLKQRDEKILQKSRPLINYNKMQKNLQKYVKIRDSRNKTEISPISVKLQRLKTKESINKIAFTEPDI